MRTTALFALLVAVPVGCGVYRVAGAAFTTPATNAFPQRGLYDVVTEEAGETRQGREAIGPLDVRAFELFIGGEPNSRCRDREVSIGAGKFSFTNTCDAPDGDIHNIKLERQGTYSIDAIHIEETMTLWGTPYSKTIDYRLRSK